MSHKARRHLELILQDMAQYSALLGTQGGAPDKMQSDLKYLDIDKLSAVQSMALKLQVLSQLVLVPCRSIIDFILHYDSVIEAVRRAYWP